MPRNIHWHENIHTETHIPLLFSLRGPWNTPTQYLCVLMFIYTQPSLMHWTINGLVYCVHVCAFSHVFVFSKVLTVTKFNFEHKYADHHNAHPMQFWCSLQSCWYLNSTAKQIHPSLQCSFKLAQVMHSIRACVHQSIFSSGKCIYWIVCNGSATYLHYATNGSSVTRRWASILHWVLSILSACRELFRRRRGGTNTTKTDDLGMRTGWWLSPSHSVLFPIYRAMAVYEHRTVFLHS